MDFLGVSIAIAFLLSLALVKILTIQFRQKLIDLPNERSSHSQPTPRGGGLGFVLSFFTVLGLATLTGSLTVPGVWLSLIPLVLIGFLDDWQNLPASVRYIVQLSVSGIAIASLGAFPLFPNQSDFAVLEVSAIVLTTIGMTALINFYNFMDGLDGLVAGTTIIQLGFLAIWSSNLVLWLLVASLLGFLIWNWQPAKIFMGDAGSTFLGACVAISLLNNSSNTTLAWSALAITLPITGDAIYTLIRRLLQQDNIFTAHRSHLFQRLHQSGWSHRQVALTYMSLTALMAIMIGFYGPVGALVSLITTVAMILLAERYLQSRVAREI